MVRRNSRVTQVLCEALTELCSDSENGVPMRGPAQDFGICLPGT